MWRALSRLSVDYICCECVSLSLLLLFSGWFMAFSHSPSICTMAATPVWAIHPVWITGRIRSTMSKQLELHECTNRYYTMVLSTPALLCHVIPLLLLVWCQYMPGTHQNLCIFHNKTCWMLNIIIKISSIYVLNFQIFMFEMNCFGWDFQEISLLPTE